MPELVLVPLGISSIIALEKLPPGADAANVTTSVVSIQLPSRIARPASRRGCTGENGPLGAGSKLLSLSVPRRYGCIKRERSIGVVLDAFVLGAEGGP